MIENHLLYTSNIFHTSVGFQKAIGSKLAL